jgi:DNA-binding CsgD family transcriptional regulator
MNHLRFLKMIEEISDAASDQDALTAILRVFSHVVAGEYYAAYYGTGGKVFLPHQGWLGAEEKFVKSLARHAHEHPFCQDFYSQQIPRVYWRSKMVQNEIWHETTIYREVDAKLGVEDMIGLYYTTSAGEHGAVHCGRKSTFSESDFRAATAFHTVTAGLLHARRATPLHEPKASDLSARETDVIRWVAEGKTNSEVASILGISHHTVRKHLERILPKMGAENRTGAAREWIQQWSAGSR